MDFGLTFFGLAYLIAIVIPGLLFKRFYFQGKFSKQFFDGLFVDRLLTNVFWGIVIQLITVFSYFWFFNIRLGDLINDINTYYKEFDTKKNIPLIEPKYIAHFLRYFGANIITAISLGCCCHLFVRFFRLDIMLSIFRFSNQWHYYFSGEALRFKEFRNRLKNKNNKVISTEVDVVVKESDGITNMFTGFLTQYTLCKTGELETIYITDTKRFVKKDDTFKSKVIPGDCFIIPYNNILNLNVRYNITINPKSTRKIILKLLTRVLLVIALLSVFFAIIFPFFVAPGFWRKLFSSIILVSAWISLMNIALSLISENKNEVNLRTPLSIIIVAITTILLILWGLVVAQVLTWEKILHSMIFWS